MTRRTRPATPARSPWLSRGVLRGAGLNVPMSSTIAFGEAIACTGIDDRDTTYWAGRATLVRRPEDHELFDRAFAVFWEHAQRRRRRLADEEPTAHHAGDRRRRREEPASPRLADASDDPTIELRFSATEVLRHKDFAEYSTEELFEAQHLMSRLRFVGSPRRRRGSVATAARTASPDLRRTVRAAMRAGGEPIRRHYRRATRNRRLVLLLDVSGSMEPYARALLRFVHAAVAGRQKVEAFALGTRRSRGHPRAVDRDPDAACARRARSLASSTRRRYPARRRASTVQRRVGPARHGPRSDRGDPVRRLGPRRPRACSPSRWRGCTASPTGSSGSTR